MVASPCSQSTPAPVTFDPDDISATDPLPDRPVHDGASGAAFFSGEPMPIPWLCQPMQIAPGRPTVFYGPPDSCKTVALQQLAIAALMGRPFLGHKIRRCAVGYVDFDFGLIGVRSRFRALLDDAGVHADRDPTKSDPRLHYLAMHVPGPAALQFQPGPVKDPAYHATMVERWTAAMTGYGLFVVDSYETLMPGFEEISNAFNCGMKALGKASEATGCSVVVVHHTGKDESAGLKGNTSVTSAVTTAWRFRKPTRDGLVRVTLEKHNLGDAQPPLTLTKVSLGVEGCKLVNGALEALPDAATAMPDKAAAEKLAAMTERIMQAVRAKPGISRREMQRDFRVKNDTLGDALRWLVQNRCLTAHALAATRK